MRQMAVDARDGMGEGGAGSEKNTRMHRKQCIFGPLCTLLVSFKWVAWARSCSQEPFFRPWPFFSFGPAVGLQADG